MSRRQTICATPARQIVSEKKTRSPRRRRARLDDVHVRGEDRPGVGARSLRAVGVGSCGFALFLGACAIANTPQQDLAYARWAKCNAPFVALEWVALDGRITFTVGSPLRGAGRRRRAVALNSGGLLPKTGEYPWRVYVSVGPPLRLSAMLEAIKPMTRGAPTTNQRAHFRRTVGVHDQARGEQIYWPVG